MNLRSLFVSVALLLTLTACHADVTYRFDVHQNGTVTVTNRMVVDDQLYTMALSQSHNSDPFGTDASQRNGWDVTKTTDENSNHIVTMLKTMPLSDLKANAASVAMPGPGGKSLPFNMDALTTTPGLFTDRQSINTSIPALAPANAASASNPYAGAAGGMLASIVALHLVLGGPGRVVSTNGETLPDGAVRWTLGFQDPTRIQYTLETTDYLHVIIAVFVVLALLIVAAVVVMRRKSALPLAGR